LRILFVSNFLPPPERGGYEQWCAEVADALSARGHQLAVLTSRESRGGGIEAIREVEIHRVLHREVQSGMLDTAIRILKDRRRLEQENLELVQELVARLDPDVALIWGMWNVPRSVPALLERLLGDRVAYYLCDYWPSLPSAYLQQWQADARRPLTMLPKKVAGRLFLERMTRETTVTLELRKPICVSRAVRELLVQAGVPIGHASVIHGGAMVEEFSAANGGHLQRNTDSFRLVLAGRLTPDKGADTAVDAMRLLASTRHTRPISLDIVGLGGADFGRELRAFVNRHGLEAKVRFLPPVPRTQMPALLAGYNALLLPSRWPEPFARIVLEAMAAGLVVIGTSTGGTGEVLIDQETGLCFPPGDAVSLAAQVERVAQDEGLARRLSEEGQRRVRERFTFLGMVEKLEAALVALAANGAGES
jgi:glycogen synthase